jgi:hypothetical protein
LTRVDARKVLPSLNEEASPEMAVEAAWARSELGDIDEAFRLLEFAYKGRSQRLPWVGSIPFAERLRKDARFANLLRRMNLPDARASLPRRSGASRL